MAFSYLQFEPLLLSLLTSKTESEAVAVAARLASLFEGLLLKSVPNRAYTSTRPTRVNGGVALSSQHALDCLKDPLRTVRFIKGVHAAILDALARFPGERINLLYAGCGPAAALIVPLLPAFAPQQLSVTLLDVNGTSVTSVLALLKTLRASAYINSVQLGDAATFQFEKSKKLHIVLTETMDKGLTKEPQLRIVQNLAPQLAKNGILLPESIHVYTEHSFYGKEPYFDIYKNVSRIGPAYPSENTKLLFTIDRNVQCQPVFHFESGPIDVPVFFEETPDVCIFAEVVIYGKLKLEKSKSLLSNPVCVASLYNLKCRSYTLVYTATGIPNWALREI
ncbi:MAG: hypothetical protein ACPGU0_02620 [Marinirhabdus sp.]